VHCVHVDWRRTEDAIQIHDSGNIGLCGVRRSNLVACACICVRVRLCVCHTAAGVVWSDAARSAHDRRCVRTLDVVYNVTVADCGACVRDRLGAEQG
jgi:hypothetical protein